MLNKRKNNAGISACIRSMPSVVGSIKKIEINKISIPRIENVLVFISIM